MHARQGGRCCKLADFRIMHLVSKAQNLLSDFKDTRSNGDEITSVQLAQIADLLLDGGHPPLLLAQEGWRHAQNSKELPGGFVKFADIPHDIHMPHVIALPGVDDSLMRRDEIRQGFAPFGTPTA